MQQWKRVEPTIVTKVGYRTLVEKTFILPDGETASYTTIDFEGREAVAVLAITKDKKVLVARQFRTGPELVMDELPGGFVDAGEEPKESAARELHEETGYEPGTLTFLGTAHYDGYANIKRHCFLATDCVASDKPAHPEDLEFIELKLISIDQLIQNAKAGRMTDPGAVLMAYDELMKLKEDV